MKKVKKKTRKMHLQTVNEMCVATNTGYYGGKRIREGIKFKYTSVLKNGRFPLWCKPIDEKFESEFSELSEKEQDFYLKPTKKVDSSNESLSEEKIAFEEEKSDMQKQFSDSMNELDLMKKDLAEKLAALDGGVTEPAAPVAPVLNESNNPFKGEEQAPTINNLV